MAYDLAKVELAKKKRFLLRQKKVQDKIMAYLKSFKNINGEVDYAQAARSILDYNNFDPRFASITAQMEFVEGKAHELLVKVMDEQRMAMGGFKSKKQKANETLMLRELMGESTGNAMAKEFATAKPKSL